MVTNSNMSTTIFNEVSLTKDECNLIDGFLKKIIVKKGCFILKANNKVTDQYYVESGCLRTFFVDTSGKEHTLQFAIKDWWISDYTAFFKQSNALLNIECIQDAVLYRLSKKNVDIIFEKIPQINVFSRKKLETSLGSFQKRLLENLSKTAKERYLDFVRSYPNIEQSIKNYHIASYLGITKESLSRIRKDITIK